MVQKCGLYFAPSGEGGGGDIGRRRDFGPVPLKSVSVNASVVHAVAQVEISQVYKNEEKTPIEAIYFFPVDSNGAVVHFQAEMEDGRVIKVHNNIPFCVNLTLSSSDLFRA